MAGTGGLSRRHRLRGEGHQRRRSPASRARRLAHGDRDQGTKSPRAETVALSQLGHLFPSSPKTTLLCTPKLKFCNRGRLRQRKVPSGTIYRCLSPRRAERRDPGRGGRTWAQPSPPCPGSPGSRPSPASPPGVAGTPRGRAQLGGPRPAPHLEPQAGPRPRPRRLSAPAAGSLTPPPAHRFLGCSLLPAHLRRGERGAELPLFT